MLGRAAAPFEQRWRLREELSLVNTLGKRIPGIGNCKCKGPKAGTHLHSQGTAGKQREEGGGADLAGPEEGCILLSLMDQECLVPAAQSRR